MLEELVGPALVCTLTKVLDRIEVPLAKGSAENGVLFGAKGSAGRPALYPGPHFLYLYLNLTLTV